MNSALQKYLKAFVGLKRGITKYGLAPHKPVLLLSLIELIDKGEVTNNQFEVNADLVATFKENWLLLVPTLHQSDFTQPFYYLQSEKVAGKSFWSLQPNLGMQLNSHNKSVNRLSEICAFGYFDPELAILLIDKTNRMIAKNLLLDTYFSAYKANYISAKNHGDGYLHQQEEFVLNEPMANYKRVIINTEEDDKVTNGIALCPNLHRAFDRGLVSISNDYTVLLSNHLIENEKHTYALNSLIYRKIILPKERIHFPELAAITWHRENIFKN